jgi:hypothetical protein
MEKKVLIDCITMSAAIFILLAGIYVLTSMHKRRHGGIGYKLQVSLMFTAWLLPFTGGLVPIICILLQVFLLVPKTRNYV